MVLEDIALPREMGEMRLRLRLDAPLKMSSKGAVVTIQSC
jgi:hypothetical protein